MLDRILESATDWFIYFAGLGVVLVVMTAFCGLCSGVAWAWKRATVWKSRRADGNAP